MLKLDIREYHYLRNSDLKWVLRSLTLSEPSLVIIGRILIGKSSRKAHLSCCQMTTFFWCCIICFTSSCLVLVNISQSNHWVCFLDQQPQLSQPFYVILINYGLQRHLVDEFELILWHLRDDTIQINVVLQASFNEPSPKIFLKEMCLFWCQSPPGHSSFPKIIEAACYTKIGMP